MRCKACGTFNFLFTSFSILLNAAANLNLKDFSIWMRVMAKTSHIHPLIAGLLCFDFIGLTYWRPLDYLPVLRHDVQQPVGRSGRSYRHEHEDLNEVQLLIVRQQRQKSSRRKRRPVVGG